MLGYRRTHMSSHIRTEKTMSDSHGIVIVGGGICGLATALALHRKGLDSLVLERSDSLRVTGAAIDVYGNGWRVLDQLGLGMELRKKSVRISRHIEVVVATKARRETPLSGEVEKRCVKRSDLIEALANSLPPGAIRFGCHVVAIGKDPVTSFPVLHLHDGSLLHTKVLIGCEGVNSVVAKSLGLKQTKHLPTNATMGLTNYPDRHSFNHDFVQFRGDGVIFGMSPINQKMMHWHVTRKCLPRDPVLQKDPDLLRDSTAELLKGFPPNIIEIVKKSDVSSLSLTRIRYQAPWNLMGANFRKGTTTVAGDAMHVMGPFLGQGGSASLEDAIVLARNLAPAMLKEPEIELSNQQLQRRVGSALDKYVEERKLRMLRLSTQSYLTSTMVCTSSKAIRLLFLICLKVLFGRKKLSHTDYDCGLL